MDISNHYYEEARSMGVIRPLHAPEGKEFDQWIDKNSALWMREGIVQIRRYLSLECDYSFSFDASEECWENLIVYTYTGYYLKESNTESVYKSLIGAVAFDKVEFEDGKTEYVLRFCWIHPFCRNRGLLKESWRTLSFRFKDFLVERPLTPAMKVFLNNADFPASRLI